MIILSFYPVHVCLMNSIYIGSIRWMGPLLSETLEVSESLEHLVLLGFFFQRPLVEYFALVTFYFVPNTY